MPLDAKAVIQQINEVEQLREALRSRARHEDMSDVRDVDLAHLVAIQIQTIERFAPEGSSFRKSADSIFSQHGMSIPHYTQAKYAGVLAAIKTSYEQGYLASVQELIHADLFADLLEMADYLLSEQYKDPAAVIAGTALEEALRKLALKVGVPLVNGTRQKMAGALNDELTAANAYNKLEQKSVTAWIDLRNKAAHGHYSEYDATQVRLLIEGIRGFLVRHPA